MNSSRSMNSMSVPRAASRVANRIVFYSKKHILRIMVVLFITLVSIGALLLTTPAARDFTPSAAIPRFQDRQLHRLNEFLSEYPAGPKNIPHPETIDKEHLHGRFGEDPVTRVPIWKPEPLSFRMTPEQKTEAHRGYCFNTRVSKSLPLDREIPDYNVHECKAFDYSKFDLPKSDVVIVFHNEDLSVLLRSVVSILDRTPPHLLNEIILFNDDSNRTSHPWLFDDLPRFVKSSPKTRLIHALQRQGLMMARVHASNVSPLNGAPIIVYLDSHIECGNKWLEPLALEIWHDDKTIVTPMIHTIGADNLVFEKGALGVLSFSWTLGQTHPSKTRAVDDPIGALPGLISPVMAGGLFAASRKWFIEELEGYDPEMRLYGGEEMEIGFKSWMCGGRLLNVPCSHIGHIFRTDKFWKGQVYKVPMGEIHRNKQRVAEVWLDEFLDIYMEVAGNGTLPVGDLTHQKWLRNDKLQCKSFKWFLDTIATDVWVPDLTNARKGAIFNPTNGLCLDHMQAALWGKAGVYSCHGQKGSQSFLLDHGQIRVGGQGYKFCIEPTGDRELQLTNCDSATSPKWEFVPFPEKPFGSMRGSTTTVPLGLMKFGDLCLALRNGSAELVKACDENDSDQLLGWSSL